MEALVEQTGTDVWAIGPDLARKMRRSMARILGCWHVKMSRPFTRGNETYRTCIACGARRRFDLDHWKMVGSFYYPEHKFTLYPSTR